MATCRGSINSGTVCVCCVMKIRLIKALPYNSPNPMVSEDRYTGIYAWIYARKRFDKVRLDASKRFFRRRRASRNASFFVSRLRQKKHPQQCFGPRRKMLRAASLPAPVAQKHNPDLNVATAQQLVNALWCTRTHPVACAIKVSLASHEA